MTSIHAPKDTPPSIADRRPRTDNSRLGLAASLALSLLVHGLALLATPGMQLAAWPAGPAPQRIDVTFVTEQAPAEPTPPETPPALLHVAKPAEITAEPPAAAANDHSETQAEAPITAPQLIGQPDFSEIEKVWVRMPIRVVLRIAVSPLGVAETVTVQEADPLPTATLESVRQAFLKAHYTPARSAQGKHAAALEITVNLQPAGAFAPLPTDTRRP